MIAWNLDPVAMIRAEVGSADPKHVRDFVADFYGYRVDPVAPEAVLLLVDAVDAGCLLLSEVPRFFETYARAWTR